jgi:F-type H+-transporting ATPase subunit delta
MVGSRAALRYAKAIFELASEKNSLDTVLSDMNTVSEVLNANPDLVSVIESPVVSVQDKKEVLTKVFTSLTKETNKLLELLLSNNRIDVLAKVATSFNELYNDYKGNEKAIVVTALPLEGALETSVLKKLNNLTGKNVTLTNIVDESIIGGFILRVGDKEFNASVANQLNKLKREFILN